VAFLQGDLRSRDDLRRALAQAAPDLVMHFAGLAYVGESFQCPQTYFAVNTAGTALLLEAMLDQGVRRLLFSSSCSVYGEPDPPITEGKRSKNPLSPYARSKVLAEDLILSLLALGKLEGVVFRYFNAAGAIPGHGQTHRPETRIIPLAVDAMLGVIPPLQVFGADYPTRDGSAERDYLHIQDIAQAHVLAARALTEGKPLPPVLNLGSGRGSTVFEILHAVEAASGRPVPHDLRPRREGDAASLVADPTLAFQTLGWRAQHSDLATLVADTLEWRRSFHAL
jgi:UDP-glucose-4-epimerase GalE